MAALDRILERSNDVWICVFGLANVRDIDFMKELSKKLSPIPEDLFVNENLPPVTASKATITKARAVLPGESDEPLVDIRDFLIATDVFYEKEPELARNADAVYLRKTVAEKLALANARLYTYGFGLIVLDGHRNLEFQQRLLEFYSDPDLKTGYVSPVSKNEKLVPPHNTGGAVDLTLVRKGERLALGTEYDFFDKTAAPAALEKRGKDGKARHLRRLLAHALGEQGFVPHYLEWWHWSYGDQYWAAENELEQAIYGSIEL